MNELVFHAAGEHDTERLGQALAAVLQPGTTVALSGTLGAGKTRLVQAIAASLGIAREDVVSPTFLLCQQYFGQRTIHHLDAYRLRDEDEFRELGVEELFDSEGLTIIEWAEKVAGCLPEERIEIEIEVTGPLQRNVSIRPIGRQYQPIVAKLRGLLG